MSGFRLHPTVRIVFWLSLLLAIQCLDGWWLTAALASLALLGRPALLRGGRLIWRTRWLLLSLFVVFSWGVAGEPVVSGMTAPTYEGVEDALLHLGRLVLVLMMVAAFLEAMPLPELLAGTHHLLRPLHRFGFDSDRGVVRLLLVLRYVETLPRPRDWRVFLDASAFPAERCVETIELDNCPLRLADYALLAMLAGAGLAYGWY